MFIVEYDLVITKMMSLEDELERRLHVYDKFEDALAEYRRAKNMVTPFKNPAAENLKLSKAILKEMDVTGLL